uniref:Uncharacterized protein n=1 Tax=Podoviridae sp. ct8Lf7 TaxID=2827723 RepID=A0A8S5S0T6_9CAUD|nr:MAG TPA: hypothetical protein [Caudoviricetes sp.]DAF44351.1 MAG TPA: hypothetical protein [Podoviridae sp. ct8Lf7]DAH11959.1 MAG TPA: hypothetical protein [Caudoviricetes sp.]
MPSRENTSESGPQGAYSIRITIPYRNVHRV